jgi:CCR4-NOT transcription complex subunit 7/8
MLMLNSDDMYAESSIELLTKSGIDFKKHEDFGIDVEHFGELLISSGLILSRDITWLTFHRYFIINSVVMILVIY